MKKLTSTSFALLGLLAHRAWSAYELNKTMQGSIVRASCPRVDSRIYSEVKNLEQHGLASCEVARQGGRERQVYTITPAGREVLRAWLSGEGAGMRVEYETLLQLAFADHGGEGLTAALIDRIEAQTRADLALLMAACEQSLQEEGWRSSDTGQQHVLTVKFVRELAEARLRWVAQARAYLAGLDRVALKEQSLANYAQEVEHLRALLDMPSP